MRDDAGCPPQPPKNFTRPENLVDGHGRGHAEHEEDDHAPWDGGRKNQPSQGYSYDSSDEKGRPKREAPLQHEQRRGIGPHAKPGSDIKPRQTYLDGEGKGQSQHGVSKSEYEDLKHIRVNQPRERERSTASTPAAVFTALDIILPKAVLSFRQESGSGLPSNPPGLKNIRIATNTKIATRLISPTNW